MIRNVFSSETTEQSDCGGSGVKLGEFVLGDSLPVARWVGIDGSGFENTV
jgi:hypothetical protein